MPRSSQHPEFEPIEITADNLAGFVYMLGHPEMPDRVKVGYSNKPLLRIRNLNSAHVMDFFVIQAWAVTDLRAAESVCHRALATCRMRTRKEFFAIPSTVQTRTWIDEDTGAHYEELEVPALEAAEYLSQVLFQAGIPFEETGSSAWAKPMAPRAR